MGVSRVVGEVWWGTWLVLWGFVLEGHVAWACVVVDVAAAGWQSSGRAPAPGGLVRLSWLCLLSGGMVLAGLVTVEAPLVYQAVEGLVGAYLGTWFAHRAKATYPTHMPTLMVGWAA